MYLNISSIMSAVALTSAFMSVGVNILEDELAGIPDNPVFLPPQDISHALAHHLSRFLSSLPNFYRLC